MSDEPNPEILPAVKAGLVDRFSTVDALKSVLPYEPRQAKRLPGATIMWTGYERSTLNNPAVPGAASQDPLGGRVFVWTFAVRIWVDLGSDEQKAQEKLDLLGPAVVRALEGDRSLGGVAVDAAMATGEVGIVRPSQGKPILMLTCYAAVETNELTDPT